MSHAGYVSLLIKFVEKEEHAISFLDGHLFCQPWINFKKIEDKQRGDKLELAASKLHTTITFSPLKLSFNLWLEGAEDRFSPIFCMYSFSKSKCLPSIKFKLPVESLREFGNYGVVITNTGEFINRINNILPEFSYGLIEYIDYDNLTGENDLGLKNPILKKDRKAFGHQREFRIYNTDYAITDLPDVEIENKKIIKPNAYGGTFFSIGSLRNIAEIRTMDELFLGVEFDIENSINKRKLSKILWWDGTKYQEV